MKCKYIMIDGVKYPATGEIELDGSEEIRPLFISKETLLRLCRRCKMASIKLDKDTPCEGCEVSKRVEESEDIYDKVKDLIKGGD